MGRGTGTRSLLPVDPADVPPDAVHAVKRTLLRNAHPVDDDLARLLVAMVIAALHEPPTAEPAETPQ